MTSRKTALVTGSTSGIGLAIARAFAANGMNLVLNGFGDAAQIATLCTDLAALHGARVLYDPADMSKPDQIAGMMARTAENFGALDVLVNNAGIQHVAAVDELPPERWDAIIAINLSSAFHTIRAALPPMKARGHGRIINIASAHALVASPYKSAYVAAKHGLAGLTKTVALEVAQTGITCNAICPGYVRTPMVDRQIPDTARTRGISEESVISDVILARQASKRFVGIDEVASMATYLASDAAASITGALLSIDGGWTAS
ncbi:MAG: 3-hydroxybutyrate dehydrogenase [Casimicrobiaceae bacterium]